ncbi:LysE family translocator [Thiomicrorhabdus sediminis]|uniref:LysE family translocator n=1 Tax=Thiomicrorhabdus sediminis TaxID=2580412 RepID=A0A4P9K521_9GAMM|nr:LysE family translocator [Thiomicrorhabdus sediminis]QCU90062.1 LysE family translocator [Thiomicrorhabdus sediminis]
MTTATILAVFTTMLILALIPGPATLVTVSRTVTGGVKHGTATVFGTVVGDLFYLTLALWGLTTLSQVLGNLFVIIQYIGAVYLFYLGLTLVYYKQRLSKHPQGIEPAPKSIFSSIATGTMITLGNPKAIVFYVSFFPALIDLNSVTLSDMAILYVINLFSIGGVLMVYVLVAQKTKNALKESPAKDIIRSGSGVLLIVTSGYIGANS